MDHVSTIESRPATLRVMSLEADRRLAARARRKGGVFTRREAIEAGVAPSTLDDRVSAGRYRRLQRGVYAVAGSPDTLVARYLAAVLALGREAVLSRESAAHHWELAGCGQADRIHVTTPGRRAQGLPGITVHRTRCLPASHVSIHRSVPVTSVARTLCDLAAVLETARLRIPVSDGVRRGLTAPAELEVRLADLGRVRGARIVRTILKEMSPQERRTRSEMESLFVRVTTSGGLPTPVMNYPVRDIYGQSRKIDAAYVLERVGVELDSRAFHGLVTDCRDDDRRQNAIVLVGWQVLRFTWWDLVEEPTRIVGEVRAALDFARANDVRP